MQISAEPLHFQVNPQLGELFGILVREDVLFTNQKGEENRGARKHVERLMNTMQEPIRRVLQKDERVFYIAQAQVPLSALEQLTMSWVMHGLFQCVLVFTDRRILHFNVKRDGSWSDSVKQVHWADLREIKIAGSFLGRQLKITHADGKKDVYSRLKFAAGKKLKAILPWLKEHAEQRTNAVQGYEHLCPECVTPLMKGVYFCSRCGTTFKNEATLLKRALIIPGGGYFYCGLRMLGILTGLVEAVLLLDVLVSAGASRETKGGSLDFFVGLAFILFLIVVEKGVGYMHCRNLIREFIVDDRKQFALSASM